MGSPAYFLLRGPAIDRSLPIFARPLLVKLGNSATVRQGFRRPYWQTHEAVMDRMIGNGERAAMYSANRLKLGLFGANCSSGRAVTLVPERWSGSWPDCLSLAQMADEAGIEFMLPIGRWKGYGGDTDYQGATLETVTWASGLLAKTKRLTVFGTIHAPLIAPLIAAKQFVTADHIGEGRFGLNIVCGWNEGEFEMFGATLRDHQTRYDYAQEWLDVIKLAWSPRADFDFDGRFIKLKGVRAKPKPYGATRPVIMNAGASPTGQSFAIRNCDALFSNISNGISFEETARHVKKVKTLAQQSAREIDVYTVGVVTCRPTARKPRNIIITALSTTPIGRQSTTSWRCGTSRRKRTRRKSFGGCGTIRRTEWAGCR